MLVGSHPPLKSTFNEHPLACTTALRGAPISLNSQSGKLVAVPGCRHERVKRVRSQQFLLQFLSITIQRYSWDCQLVIFTYNLKNQNAFRCYKSMSHSPTPAVHSTQKDELPRANDSTLLSQTRSSRDGQVVLHVPIVRKNCLRSIVLKQNQWHLAVVLSNLMSLSSVSLYSRELNLVTWGHSAPDSSGGKPQDSNPGHPWELYGISPAHRESWHD